MTRLLTSFHDRFSCWCSASVAHGADEPRAPLALQRKDGEKIGRVQGDVQLAVHRRPARFDVGDVEEMVVGAARETDLQRLAHGRMRAVAAGDVGGLARLDGAVRPLQARDARRRRLLEAQELRPRSTSTPASARRSINRRSCSSCGKISA